MTPDELMRIRREANHQYGGSRVLKLLAEYEALRDVIEGWKHAQDNALPALSVAERADQKQTSAQEVPGV